MWAIISIVNESLLVQKATPKRNGCPAILTQAQVEELIKFVYASSANRRMPYKKLAEVLRLGVGDFAVRTVLERDGFSRRLAMRKPPIN